MIEQSPITPDDAERGQVNDAAAEVYDRFFVPALFGQFVEPVLDHAGVGPGERVLDVGCGTGIVARGANRRVGTEGEVAAVDPNEGMLAVASRSDQSIDWRSGIAESLPFPDRTFDRCVTQFAAMFFIDRPTAMGEMERVVVRGGTVTMATWAGLEHTPGYRDMVGLVADELGDQTANALRAPFVLGAPDEIRALVAPLGADVRIDEVPGTARFASIEEWVHTDVRGWTLADLVDDDAESALVERARRELAGYTAADGSVLFPAPAIVATVVTGS